VEPCHTVTLSNSSKNNAFHLIRIYQKEKENTNQLDSSNEEFSYIKVLYMLLFQHTHNALIKFQVEF
jgi:hypothetical protein